MKIKVLKKGDKVLFVNAHFIAVQRKNGEVDLIPIILDENGIPNISINNITTITYGDNAVEAIVDGENGEISIMTF